MHQLSLLVLAATATASEFHGIVKEVNSANLGWRAEVPSRFNSSEEGKALCGTFLKGHPKYRDYQLPAMAVITDIDVPASFDSRDAFPKCPLIGHVRDQSACASCWAFAGTEAYESRLCVSTGKSVDLSEEDVLACNGGDAGDCTGGQPASAMIWIQIDGAVTGGDYNETGTCKPYTLPPCAHHSTSPKYKPCPSHLYPTPACKKTCVSDYSKSYTADKIKGGHVAYVLGIAQIKAALVKGGPLATAFHLYADFLTYKSGVYQHQTGEYLGGHAVLIIGYGTEAGTDYWLVKNSWNDSWGADGFFKIAHGECDIDDGPITVTF